MARKARGVSSKSCADKSQAEKRCLLGYNKNYTTLVLNYVLKNSNGMLSVLGTCK